MQIRKMLWTQLSAKFSMMIEKYDIISSSPQLHSPLNL